MPASSSLQLAALALHLGLLDSAQYRELDEALRAGADPSTLLAERGWLDANDVGHLQRVLERCLKFDPAWLYPIVESASAISTWNATPPLPAGDAKQQTPLATSYRRFRIQQLHATGGIGRVWIAHDDVLGRQVALKDLRPEVSKPGYQVRFVEEAKITARLEHPGIVPVYELARGEDGQPFYVMRFVKGKTLQDAIARYHDARQAKRAKPVEFLRLIEAFRAICQTVAYAHAQGVLHRDLKPANILLGDFGEVLVLDWGLAKSGSGEAGGIPGGALDTSDHAGSATQAGQILGTPSYMSPEQAAGRTDAIDTRSDVWGLGAILYEILTASPPFRADTIDELLRKIKEDVPHKPRAHNRDAPAPLEAVCLKALAKQPADRYASAAALADEIGRFLADEPVAAQREPLTQRVGRWMRRNRALVTGVSALLVTAVVALSISTVLIGKEYSRAETNLKKALDTAADLEISNTRVKKEHGRAEANLEKALDAVEKFYVHVSENRLLDEPGMQPLRSDLLRDAVRYGENFAAENQNDPRRRADLARFNLLLGRALERSDERARALHALEKARTLYAELRKETPQATEYLRGEAQAELTIGVACRNTEPERARQSYESALTKFERLVKDDAGKAVDREKLALTHNSLGVYFRQKAQIDKALEHQQLALDQAEELCKAEPDNRIFQHDRAGFMSNVGDILREKGKLADARKLVDKALEIRVTLAQAKTKDLWLDEQLAASHQALGIILLADKNSSLAEGHLRDAIRLRLVVVARNPGVARYRQALALDHYHLGRVMERLKKLGSAFAETTRAIDIQTQVQKELADDAEAAANLGRVYAGRGNLHFRNNDPEPALAAFQQAAHWLELARKTSPTMVRVDLLDTYWSRAQAHSSLADYASAVLDFDRALEFVDAANRNSLEEERSQAVKKRDDKK